ncbi:MAG: beta-ketoacyl-ACP synthase [Myxococcota bacterium]
MARRVVITGIGLATPIGHDLDALSDALQHDRHGIRHVSAWGQIGEMMTRLAGEITDLDFKGRWPRKKTRTMGRVSQLAAYASDRAIEDAGLDEDTLHDGRTGLCYGSTHGSSLALEEFCRRVFANDTFEGVPSSAFLRFMSNTTTANLALLYGIRGRVVSTCAACVSASQAVGTGYEAIARGVQDVMVCGGSEELHWVPAGVFDIFQATSSKYNDRPDESPRPFDRARDGLVVSEGAGTMVLEDLERAQARGATIYAEILGYGTNCDGAHVTAPSAEGMAQAMRLALADAELDPSAVDYINAHATGTLVGDIAESRATHDVMGPAIPISSTKAFTGHTLGACGTIELAMCIAMMRDGFVAPSRNLEERDPECADLAYVFGDPKPLASSTVMSNNFAFGGINTSLILGKLGRTR